MLDSDCAMEKKQGTDKRGNSVEVVEGGSWKMQCKSITEGRPEKGPLSTGGREGVSSEGCGQNSGQRKSK